MVHNQRKRGQKSSANNQRVKKTNTDTNETTLYAWTSDRIFGEYDAQGNLIQETVYLGNTLVGIIKPDGVYRIYADQSDTPRLITDETNRPVWQWDDKPFGDSQPNEDLDGNGTPFHYNLRFPGQYYDAETKTHYNFNRDYEPETGRYVQSDPIGLDGGLNTYAYVGENPVASIDPKGQSFLSGVLNGARAGGSVCGPYCAAVGAIIGGSIGVGISDAVTGSFNKDKFKDVYYHYTDELGWRGIVSSNVIVQNNGVVYASKMPLSPTEVENIIFIGNPAFKGKGEYVIIFKPKYGVIFEPISLMEEVHYGSLYFNTHIDVIYSGKNLFQ